MPLLNSAETREMHTLCMQAVELARALRSAGVARDDKSLLVLARQAEAITADLAVRWLHMHDADEALAGAE